MILDYFGVSLGRKIFCRFLGKYVYQLLNQLHSLIFYFHYRTIAHTYHITEVRHFLFRLTRDFLMIHFIGKNGKGITIMAQINITPENANEKRFPIFPKT